MPLFDAECLRNGTRYIVSMEYLQWRLKPSASKTISSLFHLHSTSATRELSVYPDGQHLWHECHPTYLGVTVDCMLSFGEHLTKTAGKLKNRNNFLMKLAGSTWGASANTLRLSALVFCDSWPIQPDILSPPLLRLTSRKPLWLDLQPVDIKR